MMKKLLLVLLSLPLFLQAQSVVDIVVNSDDHNTLEAAVVAAGLADDLSGDGPFTVFAPTDAAFEALGMETINALLNNPEGSLKNILLYHVLSGEVVSSSLMDGMMAPTLLGDNVTVSIDGNTVRINNAEVTFRDIDATNGVVHVLDAVILPQTSTNTVVDIVYNSDDHNTLEAAIKAANVSGALNSAAAATVFAPTDAAFEALGMETINALLNNPEGSLRNILLYHVVGATVLSTDLMDGMTAPTVLGDDITVSIDGGTVKINDAEVIVRDIETRNGVVHVLDAVLLPSTNTNTIVDVIYNSDVHATLEIALKASGLSNTLNAIDAATVFAPTDDAFSALPDGVLDELLDNPTGLLAEILTYHVVPGTVLDSDLTDGMIVETVSGDEVEVTINTDGVFINDARVTVTNLPARNGVVHVIDGVLLPRTSVKDVVYDSPNHNILEVALDTSGLGDVLDGDGPFTLFAPTDAAFGLLPDGTIEALLSDPSGLLTEILLYHALDTRAPSSSLTDGQRITTINGRDIIFTVQNGEAFINNAKISVVDLPADNGVVHVIDAVLIPGNSIFDIVAGSPDHTLLETAIRAANLEDALSDDEAEFTLFAPNDDAFNALPDGVLDAVLNDANLLFEVLGLHVLDYADSTSVLVDADPEFAINGSLLSVNDVNGTVQVNGVDVIAADIEATNGFVNVIGSVLLAPDSTITEIVDNSSVHMTLSSLIDSAEVRRVLDSYGPWTLFAPTDEAFGLLDPVLVSALLANEDLLLEVLGDHLLFGSKVLAEDLSDGLVVQNVVENDLTFSINGSEVQVNGVNIIATNLEADNGVVHVVDGVINVATTIWDIVRNSDVHTTLEVAIEAAGLDEALRDADGELTLFAPTDSAFDLLPDGTVEALLADPSGLLTDILTYHVVGGIAFSGDLSDGLMIETLNGKSVTVTINNDGVFINDAEVIIRDLDAVNGVVHVIDAVLLPPSNTITDIVVADDELTTLETAVLAAGLDSLLASEGPFTVFAPTDEAFGKLPMGTIETLLMDPTGQLADILQYHVTGGTVLAGDLSDGQSITMANGDVVNVTINNDGVFINQSQVIMTDIMADNGVIHKIDVVLLPPVSTDDKNIIESTLFPNPSADVVNYNIPEAKGANISIRVYDLDGKILMDMENMATEGKINLNNFNSGTYIIELVGDEFVSLGRVTKI